MAQARVSFSATTNSHISSLATILNSLLLIALVLLIDSRCCWAKDNQTAILLNIRKYDSCVIQSTFSYSRLLKSSHPPTTVAELKTICKLQAAAFKCIKEKSRDAQPIIRRGLLSYVSSRQRHFKKYCTNPESGLSRNFVEDIKCNMEKRFEQHERADDEFELKLMEIFRRNYNDSATELKLLCCSFLAVIQQHNAAVGKECAHTARTIDELARTVIPEEMNLICEDEDKLVRTCANTEQITISKDAKVKRGSGPSPAAFGLFLIATLGEPMSGGANFGL